MQEHSICGGDLPVHDRLVLRATVRLFEGNALRWHYVEDPSLADVLLFVNARRPGAEVTNEATENSRVLRVAVAPVQSAPSQDGIGLVMPLRARELVRSLALMENRLAHLREQEQRAGASSHKHLVIGSIADATGILGQLTSGPALAELLPLSLHIGPSIVVTIEHDGMRLLPGGLFWRTQAVNSVRLMCSKVAEGAALELTSSGPATRRALPVGATCIGTFSQLIWALAAHELHPRPAMSLNERTRFSLKRWPDFAALPATPIQVHLSALLARRRLTLSQLAELGSVGTAQALAVLNACHWLDLLVSNAGAEPVLFSPQLFLQDKQVRLEPRGLGGLVRSIRAALRAAVARSQA